MSNSRNSDSYNYAPHQSSRNIHHERQRSIQSDRGRPPFNGRTLHYGQENEYDSYYDNPRHSSRNIHPERRRSFESDRRPPFNGRTQHHGQENEYDKRKRSFVVIGLPELPTESDRERQNEDHTAAIDIVRYLGISDYIPDSNVRRSRNGAVLIVTLESIQSRDLLLRREHFLNANAETRYLTLARAHTAQDIANRFNRMSNDRGRDGSNPEYNMNRREHFNDYRNDHRRN